MNELVPIATPKHPKEFEVIIYQSMVQHSLRWDLVDHHAAGRSQVVDYLKGVQLIRNVLCRAKICYQIIAAARCGWSIVEIQIEWDAPSAAINIDRRILEPQPVPKFPGRWS